MFEFIAGATLSTLLWHLLSDRKPRRDRPGLADLLPYGWIVGRHTILLKDGSLMTAFRVVPLDTESTSPAERLQRTVALHNLFMALPPGWSIETSVHRLPVRPYFPINGAAFPTRSLWSVERERAEYFNRLRRTYVSEVVVTIVQTPDRKTISNWSKLLTIGNDDTTDPLSARIRRFESRISELMDMMKSIWPRVSRLLATELVTECHRCLTGLQHPVIVDTPDVYLAPVIASCDMITGYIPVVGGRYVGVIGISSFGSTVGPDILARLVSYNDEFRLHLRFIPLTRSEAESRMRMRTIAWHHKVIGFRSMVFGSEKNRPGDEMLTDENARAMLTSLQELRKLLDSGIARLGYLNASIIMFDSDKEALHDRVSKLLAQMREWGMTCDYERLNATHAFLGSLPGCGGVNMRRPLYTSAFVADLFPITHPWPGHATAPSRLLRHGGTPYPPPLMVVDTRGDTPFRLNIHAGDIGHTLIVGGTGGGKSVLVDMICHSWLRYKDTRVFIIDVDRSHFAFVRAARGQMIVPDEKNGFQPLRDIGDPDERSWALDFVRLLLELNGYEVTPQDTIRIETVLREMGHSPLRTMEEFVRLLANPGLAAALTPYTRRGVYPYLDSDSEEFDPNKDRVLSIEIGPLINRSPQAFLPVLEIIFRRIERSLTPEHPTLIILEESWAALGNERFARRVQEWLYRIRKLGGAVLLVGHSPEQFTAKSAINVIGQCPTKIFLPNPEAETLKKHYIDLGLNEFEVALLRNATPRREYLLKHRDGTKLFSLVLGDRAKLLCGIWPEEGLNREEVFERIDDIASRNPDAWIEELYDQLSILTYAKKQDQDDSDTDDEDMFEDNESEEYQALRKLYSTE